MEGIFKECENWDRWEGELVSDVAIDAAGILLVRGATM